MLLLRLSPSRKPVPVEQRARFDGLRYSNCWEDAATVCDALGPLEGARCLSIASAGDNTLSLLARGAREVVAVDLSPAQLALVELKRAAFRALAHEELLGFLGVSEHAGREGVYRGLRVQLSPEARRFWDARPRLIRDGVVHAGRLERYFRLFRRRVLPLVHSRRTTADLLRERSREERERFYAHTWDGWRWRLLFRLFFCRASLGGLGRDPELFRYVEGPVAAPILERSRHGLTAVPTADNPYLHYILTGRFGPRLPDYLEPRHHARIRAGLDRVRLAAGPVERLLAQTPAGTFDALNLSDVGEYMDRASFHRLLAAARRSATPGARLAYWNLLADRRRPASMASALVPCEPFARHLHARSRTFFYRALVLEVAG